ncbi:alpha/beta fold hydrolase [Nocardioides sp.]|uniref:alpha/beta fold hydrolase n=1 Tax=Nocardioides sp. TaxID=35761 RepID=UPI0027288F01|nr:alpha/beta hydrolase [Nocardioides sp.]MDO9456827.1 alpha/beta hydrolase [Nocardioides sp.]
MAPELVTLPDGRRAQVWLGGAGAGPLVLVLHGCPDTRHVAMTGHTAALALGVRLLCVNRPGYGASDPHASTQGSVADDAVAVARSLGVERLAVLGMSVGCSYALAVAARHPGLVAALGLVAAQSPSPEPGTVADKVERFRRGFEQYAATLAPGDPDDEALARRFLAQLPPADAAVLGAVAGAAGVAAATREALTSPEGYLRDAALLLSAWDHTPEQVAAPVHLWFGGDDDRSSADAADAWTRRFADPRVVVRPGTTHPATLVAHWPEILGTLRDHLGD